MEIRAIGTVIIEWLRRSGEWRGRGDESLSKLKNVFSVGLREVGFCVRRLLLGISEWFARIFESVKVVLLTEFRV